MVTFALLVVLMFAVSCGIGAWIGSTKDRTAMGAVLGVFGMMGWLIIALVPARDRRYR